jgi:hypothetical protein
MFLFLSVSLSVFSSLALAQPRPGDRTKGTEAEAHCTSCQAEWDHLNNLRAIQDVINRSSGIAGLRTQEVVREIVREDLARENWKEAQQARINADKNKYAIVFDKKAAFTQQSFDEMARLLKVRGWDEKDPVHIYFLQEIDKSQKEQARSLMSRALRKSLGPQENQIKNYAQGQWKILRKNISSSETDKQEPVGPPAPLEEIPKRTVLASEYYAKLESGAAPMAEATVEEAAIPQREKSEPPSQATLATLTAGSVLSSVAQRVQSVNLGDRQIKVQVYSSESPEARQYVGIVGGHRTGVLEARASKKINSSFGMGVTASIGKREGIDERAIYLFIGGEFDAYFQPLPN